MCMPHASPKHSSPERREKRDRTPLTAFNKELLKPNPDFIDERKDYSIANDKKSFLDKLFGS